MKKTAPDEALASFALCYPESVEEHPWGERAFKVRRKVFLFLSRHDGRLSLSVKLPVSHREALLLPFSEPTGYGLGKHKWVTARFDDDATPPLGVLRQWIDESFRAVAPKTLVKTLPAEGPPSASNETPSRLRKKA